ncbi:MAG TPA: methionyl-tRNA formyltransferase [Nitrospira sp.]|nr:methionyl-tRNA formyltransferase [Nitrospira sp.]
MRIVFMGTPDFAVPSLEALLNSDDDVVGVVTQPDRPKGRGQTLAFSPVKDLALRRQIPILQPTKMKDPDFLAALRKWDADVIAVAAFGRILPPSILSLPHNGCVNVHGSLLPRYRGAAPIQWAIINGETETGITTMLMDEGMDTGAILLQERLSIELQDTAGSLSVRMAALGGRLLIETLKRLKSGTLTPRPQDNSQATLAPILKKEDGLVDWNLPARVLADRIRGLTPWPGAYTFSHADRWVLWNATSLSEPVSAAPGTIVNVSKGELRIATGDGLLAVTELQVANSRRMTVAQYLAGHPIQPGLRLGPPLSV